MVKKKLPKAISVEKFKICNKNIEIGYVCFLRTIMTQGEKKFVLCQLSEEKTRGVQNENPDVPFSNSTPI